MAKLTPLELARREALIIERRADRVPLREIAAELGISLQRVQQIYRKALSKYPIARLDEHREEERELADRAVEDLLTIITSPSTTDGNRIRSWEVMVKWAERKARLCGLDAPIRQQVEYSDTSGWEFALQQQNAQTERELRRIIDIPPKEIEQ